MIKNSFIFLPSISSNKENKLWMLNIKTWDDFISLKRINGISAEKKEIYDKKIIEAKNELINDEMKLFMKFPSKETWRLYNYLKDEALFLDIEIGRNPKDIILIGMYDGINTKVMVKNYNMDKNIFLNELKKYKLLVTYNGKSFDAPAIEKYFGIKLNLPHIDLKYCCSKLKIGNGLKNVELNLNLKRPQNLYGKPYDVYKAFLAPGDREYLDFLIKYNEEDIVNLKPIMEYCFNNLKSNCMVYN